MEGSITDAVDDFMVPADLPVMNPIPQQVNEMSPKLMQRYGIDDEDAFDNESKEDHK